VESRSVAAPAGSTVILNCTSPILTVVEHAEWDFHRLNTDRPTLIYNGFNINPKFADKYDVLCNVSSSICDLRINGVQSADDGEYHCHLNTNHRTFNYVYALTVIGER